MVFSHSIGNRRYTFGCLRELLAKATPLRSGDVLAGVAAQNRPKSAWRRSLRWPMSPLAHFLDEAGRALRRDEVTRLIVDTHDAEAFAPVRSLTVGELRDWLLSRRSDARSGWRRLAPGLTPEMAAAVSKLMRVQDLIAAAAKIRVVTRFRTTVGLPGRLSARLQPNHPTDDAIGHCGVDSRRAAAGLGRCGDRHQSRRRQRGSDDAPAAHDRCAAASVSDSHAELRAGAHHHADGGARSAARRWI